MYHTQFLPLLKLHVKICQFLQCVAITWDEKEEIFVQTRSPKQARSFKWQCTLSIFYCGAMLLHISFGRLSQTDKFQGALFLTLAILATASRLVMDNSGVQILNTLLEFEKNVIQGYPQSPLRLADKVMKMFMQLCEISVPMIPLLQLTLLTYAPCTAPFILSMDPTCKVVMASKSIHLPTGQIERIRTTPDLQACIKLYKYIQIYEKSFNAFLQPRVIPAIITCVPAIQIIALYVCLNHNEDIEMPGFLVFPLLLVDGFGTVILIFTLASHVHNSSENVMQTLKKSVGKLTGNKSGLMRQIRSLSVLKIKFGSNFIDRGTPLVMETFCINQTVSLTLIKQGRSIR
ncbi:hypothetical protein Fcan01_24857 [Folsomia candida]|uniref:Uncharacterized protein n=1 Tax=Folsomia candida TaxID=158441 RepID=A0A226D4X4_FOLCA|nr:hypothetical protein Fcan01_24857 [Folsomia candida]